MYELRIEQLVYQQNSATLFELLLDFSWPILLDSQTVLGRYDILTVNPLQTVQSYGQRCEIKNSHHCQHRETDVFALAQTLLEQLPFPATQVLDLPFSGGAIGYFGYDLARNLEAIPSLSQQEHELPDLALGFYSWAIIVDHQQQKTTLFAHLYDDESRHFNKQLLKKLTQASTTTERKFNVTQTLQAQMSESEYHQTFKKIQHHLRAGDCYQINFAQRFKAKVQGHSWSLYRHLRQFDSSSFAAFFQLPFATILSFSPERFLQVINRQVLTQPIKGTRPRGNCSKQDRQFATELLNSSKDQAENLMIVDLLRNDISKNCYPGTIQIPKLCELRSYNHVHHLVSSVTALLKSNNFQLLKGCFPGGSITGAPKIRAMQIIESLETYRRYSYCGSIAYFSVDGRLDSNILIRSLLHVDNNLYCYAGGGITIDSTADAEYRECFDKVNWILQAMQT